MRFPLAPTGRWFGRIADALDNAERSEQRFQELRTGLCKGLGRDEARGRVVEGVQVSEDRGRVRVVEELQPVPVADSPNSRQHLNVTQLAADQQKQRFTSVKCELMASAQSDHTARLQTGGAQSIPSRPSPS